MAGKSTSVMIRGKRAKRGERMISGKGWRFGLHPVRLTPA